MPSSAEEPETTQLSCDSCGAPSTHDVYDPGDPEVGYAGGWVALCDECDPAVESGERTGETGETHSSTVC